MARGKIVKKEETEKEPVVYEPPKISTVVIHPLVLLSVVDHHSRHGKVSSGHGRVVGVLLGEQRGTTLDVSNCFAAREQIVGWYHSGPKLCPNDVIINELIRKYNSNSVLVVINVRRKESDGLPTEAYIAVDEVHDDGSPTTKTFDRLNSQIGAEEAEEVGVEHLLRDIKDTTLGPLSQRIGSQLDGLSGLWRQLRDIGTYLELVAAGKLPINHSVTYQLQNMFNLLPDLRMHDMVRAVHVNTNDQMLVIYVAAIMRAILALHDLINNKLTNRETERNEEATSLELKKSATGDHAKTEVPSATDADTAKSNEAAPANKPSESSGGVPPKK